MFFSDLLVAYRGKLGHVRAYTTTNSQSPVHAKNLNFPEYLEPGKNHEVAVFFGLVALSVCIVKEVCGL